MKIIANIQQIIKNKFKIIFLSVFPILIISGYLFTYAIGRLTDAFFINSIIFLIPIVLAYIFWFKFIKSDNTGQKNILFPSLASNKKNITVVYILFAIFFLITLLMVFLNEIRPWYYFFAISLLFCLVCIQCLVENVKPGIILFELVIIQINIFFTLTFNYPLYFGATDIIYHIDLAKSVFLLGKTIPNELLFTIYNQFPLYHIVISVFSNISGLTVQQSLFLIMGLIFSVTIFPLYCLFKLIFDSRIALLSCILYATSSVIVFSGAYMVPRSFGFVVFVVLLFILFIMRARTKSILIFFLLSFPIILAIILSHHLTTFLVSLILITYLFLIFLLKINTKNYLYILLSFLMLWIAYWIFFAEDFFLSAISNRFSIDAYSNLLITESTLVPVGTLFDRFFHLFIVQIPNCILLFFVVFAFLCLITKINNKFYIFLSFATLLCLPIWLPTPLSNVYQLETLLYIGRMKLLVAPIIILIFGYGLVKFFSYVHQKFGNKAILMGIVTILFCYSFFSMINIDFNDYRRIDENVQNYDFKPFFNQDELDSLKFIYTKVEPESYIASDQIVTSYIGYNNLFSEIKILGINNRYNYDILDIEKLNNNLNGGNSGYIFYRAGEYNSHKKLIIKNKELQRYSQTIEKYIEEVLDHNSKIFSSNNNEIFFIR